MILRPDEKNAPWILALSGTAFVTGCVFALAGGSNLWPLTGILTLPLGFVLGLMAHFLSSFFKINPERQYKLLKIVVPCFVLAGFIVGLYSKKLEDESLQKRKIIEAKIISCRTLDEAVQEITDDYKSLLERHKKYNQELNSQNGDSAPNAAEFVKRAASQSPGVILDLETKRMVLFHVKEEKKGKSIFAFDSWIDVKTNNRERYRLRFHKSTPARCGDITLGATEYYSVLSPPFYQLRPTSDRLPGTGIVADNIGKKSLEAFLREQGLL